MKKNVRVPVVTWRGSRSGACVVEKLPCTEALTVFGHENLHVVRSSWPTQGPFRERPTDARIHFTIRQRRNSSGLPRFCCAYFSSVADDPRILGLAPCGNPSRGLRGGGAPRARPTSRTGQQLPRGPGDSESYRGGERNRDCEQGRRGIGC